MINQSFYFIAIIPPPEVCDKVLKFQEDFARRFGSKKSLKVIPHITLKAPFKLPTTDQEYVLSWFKNMQVSTLPFEQQLRNFGAFHNKRNPVIFVHPEINSSLRSLQEEVLHNFRVAYPNEQVTLHELKFTPHITVAYRDLTFAFFEEAWKDYSKKKFAASFIVNSFDLLQHDGGIWRTTSTFLLGNSF